MSFFNPPEEELLERGFERSPSYDRNEVWFSYVQRYAGDLSLTVNFTWKYGTHALLALHSTVLAEVALDQITDLAFQSWHGDRIIRVYSKHADLRIHYDPVPAIFLTVRDGGS